MCEKAEEIQNLYKSYDKLTLDSPVLKIGNKILETSEIDGKQRHNIVWLPRQDQLQDMLLNEHIKLQHLISNFYEYYLDVIRDSFINSTFEVAWLMYVMDELYSKVWNEEEREWKKVRTW